MFFNLNRFIHILFISILFIGLMTPCYSEEELNPLDKPIENPIDKPAAKPVVVRKIIAIDPGHGGTDIGAVGVGLTKEKDFTLTFAKILETKLKKKFKVAMTRRGDTLVELRSRTESANKTRADLLISIHSGGSFVHETRGVGLYYHESHVPSDGGTDSVQVDYNLSPGGRTPVRWNRVQEKYIALSRTFAMILNEHLASNAPKGEQLKISVMGLPVMVLSGADMPALLIELGQLTNPSEEKQLKNKEYLATIANGICSAIETFFEQYPEKIVHAF